MKETFLTCKLVQKWPQLFVTGTVKDSVVYKVFFQQENTDVLEDVSDMISH